MTRGFGYQLLPGDTEGHCLSKYPRCVQAETAARKAAARKSQDTGKDPGYRICVVEGFRNKIVSVVKEVPGE